MVSISQKRNLRLVNERLFCACSTGAKWQSQESNLLCISSIGILSSFHPPFLLSFSSTIFFSFQVFPTFSYHTLKDKKNSYLEIEKQVKDI